MAGKLGFMAIACLWAATAACGGTLALAPPAVAGTQYTFPVELRGAGGQVSALDFRVQFDPQVFQPVSANLGPAALAANKMISSNYAAPGEYVVVMMGLNQAALPAGQVATVVMQRVAAEATGSTRLDIVDPTLATPDGAELPVSGTGVSVKLGDGDDTTAEGEDPSTPAPEGAQDDTDTPAGPENDAPTPPGAPNPAAPGNTGPKPALLGPAAPPMAASGAPDPVAGIDGTAARATEKNSGLAMPIVLGSAVPEAGTTALGAAQAGAPAAGNAGEMAANAENPVSAAPRQTVALSSTTLESGRDETRGKPVAAASAVTGGDSQPEGTGQAITLALAGALAALLLAGAFLLRKLSSR